MEWGFILYFTFYILHFTFTFYILYFTFHILHFTLLVDTSHLVDQHMLSHLPHFGWGDWKVLLLLNLVPGMLSNEEPTISGFFLPSKLWDGLKFIPKKIGVRIKIKS